MAFIWSPDFAPSHVAMEIELKALTSVSLMIFEILSLVTKNQILESQEFIAKNKINIFNIINVKHLGDIIFKFCNIFNLHCLS